MDIKEVLKGLKEGKCYQLEGWWRFYIFATDNCIYMKSPYTEPQDYFLKISELDNDNWIEVNEEELKQLEG
jgi:hypothetical protein